MYKEIEQLKQLEAYWADTALDVEMEYFQEFKKIRQDNNLILQVCKDNEEYMWAAKIISIILDCDFRDAKDALIKYNLNRKE